MRNSVNEAVICGYLYQVDKRFGKKVSGPNAKHPGTTFYSGDIYIAVDEECHNIIPVHFSYTTENWASGKKNDGFNILAQIDENRESKTVLGGGIENAYKIRVSGSLELNDFIVDSRTNPGEEERVSALRVGGRFINFVDRITEDTVRNKFTADMLITNINHVDANPDRNIEKDFVNLQGYIFTFKKEILPISFSVRNENGMKFFESLEVSPSEPHFRKVWGHVINESIQVAKKSEESAFGDDSIVTMQERKFKDWVVTGASKVPYEFGDEKELTKEEVSTKLQDREVHWASVKANRDEYMANKNKPADLSANGFAAAAATPVDAAPFNF